MIPSASSDGIDVVAFGPFAVDRAGGVLLCDGEDVSVPPKAMGVLLCLLEQPGAVVAKETLLEAVWSGTAVTDGSLTEAVRVLRGALGDNPQEPTYIQTVHRRGYRFIAEVSGPRSELSPVNVGSAPATAAATTSAPHPAGPVSRARRAAPVAIFLLLGAMLGITGYERWAGDAAPARTVVAFNFGPPPDRMFFDQSHMVTISPDGSKVVFSVTSGSDGFHLYVRDLDQIAPRPLTGTVGRVAQSPFFAPDGKRVGYVSGINRGFEVVDLASGEVEVLCTQCRPGRFGGATFSHDGSTLFFSALDRPVAGQNVIWRLAPGGTPEVLLDSQSTVEGVDYVWPHALPNDRWLLVTLQRGHTVEGARIVALDVEGGEHRTLFDDGFNARYVPSGGRTDGGYLVFGRGGALWLVGFDPETLTVLGDPVPIALEKPVAMSAETGSAGFAISNRGDLAYHPGLFQQRATKLLSVDDDGNSTLLDDAAFFRSARVSPDNSKVAVCVRGNRDEIRVYDLHDPGSYFTIRHTVSDFCSPVWRPDSRAIAFVADGRDIYAMGVHPRAEPDYLTATDASWIDLAGWSPDGKIVFTRSASSGIGGDIWAADASCPEGSPEHFLPCGPEHVRPLLATERDEVAGRLSPDGRWLVVEVDWVVHVLPFPAGEPAVEVARGNRSRWSGDGSEVYFYATGRVQGWRAAPWRGDGALSDPSSIRRLRFPGRPEDFLRNGTIIAIDSSVERAPTTEIIVIAGWANRLTSLTPAAR